MSKHLPALAALVVVSLPLAACGGSDSGSPSPSVSSTTPSDTPSASPTPSVVPTSAKPTAAVRTKAGLTKALLALKDLPPGFSVEPADEADDGSRLASSDPKCATFVKVMNVDTAPGSKASAMRSFSGGQDGPYVDESLDALGSAGAVAALQKSFAAWVRTCHKVTVKTPGAASSTLAVQEVSAPTIGTGPFAVRMTGTGGPMAGVEITMVTTGIEDVVLAMTFVGAVGEDIDAATDDAVTKAQKVLAGTSGS